MHKEQFKGSFDYYKSNKKVAGIDELRDDHVAVAGESGVVELLSDVINDGELARVLDRNF